MRIESFQAGTRVEIDAFLAVIPSSSIARAGLRLVCMIGGLPAGEVEWIGSYSSRASLENIPEILLLARAQAMRPGNSSMRVWTERSGLQTCLDNPAASSPEEIRPLIAALSTAGLEIEAVDSRLSPSFRALIAKASRAPSSRAMELSLALADIERINRSPLRAAWTEARSAPLPLRHT